jgi:hypothetical protein
MSESAIPETLPSAVEATCPSTHLSGCGIRSLARRSTAAVKTFTLPTPHRQHSWHPNYVRIESTVVSVGLKLASFALEIDGYSQAAFLTDSLS